MESELIAKRIKEMRTDAGMTQEAFGRIVGVTKHAVSRWEKGLVENLKHETIRRLSDHFNVSPLWIMGFDAPKRRQTEAKDELAKSISDSLLWLTEKDLRKVEQFIQMLRD